MAGNIKIEWNEKQILRFVKQVARQFPYAMIKSLNLIVARMQEQQRRHQLRVFTVRQKTYWKQSVKIPPDGRANLKQKRFEAYMTIDPKERKGPKFEMWKRQEEGGTRVPIRGRKSIALPQPDVKRTTAGIVRAAERPKRIMEKKRRGFEITFASGTRGLFQRLGSRQKGFVKNARGGGARLTLGQDPNVKFMYFLKKKTKIDPVYDYFHNAERVFRGNWPRVFEVELKKAFRGGKG